VIPFLHKSTRWRNLPPKKPTDGPKCKLLSGSNSYKM
jgi:hypothetical protein